MSSYSCFMSNASYKDYYAGKDPEIEPYLGREDPETGEYKVCCMPSNEADEIVARHTNEEGSVGTIGMEKDLGLDEGSLSDGYVRCDFEHMGKVQPTEKGGINDNGQCTGDGTLPSGQSDLEAVNAKRENITNVQKSESTETEGEAKAKNVEPSSPSQGNDSRQDNNSSYDPYQGYYR